MVLRPATRDDIPAIGTLVEATDMFPATLLEGMMGPYLAAPSGPERWLVHDHGGEVTGVAYCAPERFTVGTWNLLCIAVLPDWQSRGVGRALLAAVETWLRGDAGARVLLVETSGASAFARTRAFYRRRGYEEEARLRDYYQAGEDKVVFRKAFVRRAVAAEHATPSASAFALRRATSDDLPRVIELAHCLGRQHAAYDPTRFELGAFGEGEALEARYRRFFEEALEDRASFVEVAVRNDRVVGYGFARLEAESFLDLGAASGWLHDVYVAEEARGIRLGRALVAALCGALEAAGATRLRLSVSPHNPRARATFESLGFRPTMLEMQRDA